MTLWNLLRDFFVQYIFGGRLSSGTLITNGFIGTLYGSSGSSYGSVDNSNTGSVLVYIGDSAGANPAGSANSGLSSRFLSLGDWLSTTFTIITLIVFIFYLFVFLRWLFKTVSGLMLLRN